MATRNPFQNVMDIFRGAKGPADVNPNANAVPGQAHESEKVDANGVVPPQKPEDLDPNKAKSQEPKTPLEPYEKLWEPPNDKEDDDSAPLSFNVDPQKMMEAAGKVDFSRVVTPEVLQKIAAGGEEGVRASLAAMNVMAQTVYGQSAMATTKIVEHAVARAEEKFLEKIPSLLKSQTIEANLREANPMFSNPAVVPIIEGLKTQLVLKHPNATSTELTRMAQDYFLRVSEAFTPTKKPENDSARKGRMTGKDGEDWEKFFNL
jgi:hypothetical protein